MYSTWSLAGLTFKLILYFCLAQQSNVMDTRYQIRKALCNCWCKWEKEKFWFLLFYFLVIRSLSIGSTGSLYTRMANSSSNEVVLVPSPQVVSNNLRSSPLSFLAVGRWGEYRRVTERKGTRLSKVLVSQVNTSPRFAGFLSVPPWWDTSSILKNKLVSMDRWHRLLDQLFYTLIKHKSLHLSVLFLEGKMTVGAGVWDLRWLGEGGLGVFFNLMRGEQANE